MRLTSEQIDSGLEIRFNSRNLEFPSNFNTKRPRLHIIKYKFRKTKDYVINLLETTYEVEGQVLKL